MKKIMLRRNEIEVVNKYDSEIKIFNWILSKKFLMKFEENDILIQ